jgi:Uma2 family endonuclease
VHDMATTMRPGDRVPMSWDEYEALGPGIRGEYVDGELVVSPSASGPHQDISLNLAMIVKRAISPPTRIREAWAWKPAADEFVPDLIVFDETAEQVRFTGRPHLVVEILSTDRAAAMFRKAARYAAAGLERYWIIDPDGPEVIVHVLDEGVLVESARRGPGTDATFDVGPCEVTFDPATLLD